MSDVQGLPARVIEPYVSRAQLAEITGLSVRTIDRLKDSGMPHCTWGIRTVRFQPSTAIAWLNARGRSIP